MSYFIYMVTFLIVEHPYILLRIPTFFSKSQVKCDERHWIYICGPTISLLCSLIFWVSSANVMSAEELSDILVDYIMSYITLDKDHITIWLHYLLNKMSKSSSDGNFELAVKQCLFLKLFK